MDFSYDSKPGTSRYSVASVPQEDHIAIPLQIQRLEKLLVLHPYLDFCENLFKSCVELSDHTYAKEEQEVTKAHKSLDEAKASLNSQQESLTLLAEEKPKLYNFERVGKSRKWLQDLLLANSSDEEPGNDEEEIEYMKLCQHLKNKAKQTYQSNPEYFSRYKYYGAGLLSADDRYVEHQEEVIEPATTAPVKSEKSSRKQQLLPRQLAPEKEIPRPSEEKWKVGTSKHLVPGSGFTPGGANRNLTPSTADTGQKKRGRKKKELGDEVESLTNHRRKIWCLQCSKEVKKMQKAILGTKKENLLVLKRLAVGCSRIVRQKALQSEKAMKETTWRCKRISKEIQAFWKRTDRVEKTQRKQAEQEAKEQRRQDLELMEAKRQQRKLNFLITQTELYAHFMSRKLGGADPSEEGKILGQLDEEKIPRLQEIDSYDSQVAKQQVLRSVSTAFRSQQLQTRKFDTEVTADVPEYATNMGEALAHKEAEYPQPSIFQGSLKHYQLKGMNWIASIYNQGINGILADEMGLGKTVQSMAFLAHLAERYGIWGPFLIISPTSTLHNWQQEFARFVPAFKVIPYWGSPQERKILRQFWSFKNLHTQESSFHVVITSYQMIVTDYKYFQRIKWQYMILDEAQAIKSSASTRWKTLLGFNCRNRLLLSGTPIQNNMAELWALLHFIMPTLFDSHDEFNEWFSKDIEGTAESKGSRNIDEKHLTRLHMILKPFMLRRIKKDVENELSEKIEIMMYCPLTLRQKALCKKKIRIEDLLYSGHSTSASSSATSNLANIVMQLRKVCNHPELFERRDVKSPFHARLEPYYLPKLIYREGILSSALPSKRHILEGSLTIWKPEWILRSLDPKGNGECGSEFSFLRFIGMSIAELILLMFDGMLARLKHYLRSLEESSLVYLRQEWQDQIRPVHSRSLLLEPGFRLSHQSVISSPVIRPLVFVSNTCSVQSFGGFMVRHVRETIEHRIMRTKKKRRALRVQGKLEASDELLPEIPFVDRKVEVHDGYWIEYPTFIDQPCLKASAPFRGVYCSDRSASWWLERHQRCTSSEGMALVLNGQVLSSRRPEISFSPEEKGGILSMISKHGWSGLVPPDKDSLVGDSGKMRVLDGLLKRLKDGGHRVLIYSQMTRVIDLLEEYLRFRHLTYIRLDGSSRIAERRDMVADFQSRSDIFVFLLSTRAGGLGLNLTAADTVIFYDSDWNPTVDEQAMDRAHRLGQTKQVTVYRLICKGTVEERILQRAREKSEIQRMVISGGQFKPETSLKPKEVVSLLLDDDELEKKYRQRRLDDEAKEGKKRKARSDIPVASSPEKKRIKAEALVKEENGSWPSGSATPSIMSSAPASPARSELSVNSSSILQIDEDSDVTEGIPASRSHSPSVKSTSMLKTYSSSNLEFDVSPLLPGLSHRSRPFRARGVGRRGRPAARRGRGSSRGGATATPGTGLDSDEEDILKRRERGPNKRGPGRPRTKPPVPANHVPRARGRPRGSTAKALVGSNFPPPSGVVSSSFSRLSDDEDADF